MARTIAPQDVSWFLDLHEKGQLDLDPPYQRRSVWSPKDRRYFVDTILNDYPAPPVFLHKTLNESLKPTYHVVDGKQRLQTIILFAENKIRIPEDFVTSALQGKRWKDLERTSREKFLNYVIIVEMLPDASESNIRSTFERINRNSRKLSPQEMRHAKYEGWFSATAESEADRTEWKTLGISTTARAKRMQDIQFVSELMLLVIKGNVSGFNQNDLDDIYAEYDDLADLPDFDEDDFRTRFDAIRAYVTELVQADASLALPLRVQLNMYSLWGYLVSTYGNWYPVHEFAGKYRQFLNDLSAAEATLIGDTLPTNEFEGRTELFAYANNARGASTDLTQRQGRHDALMKAFPAPGAAVNEGQ